MAKKTAEKTTAKPTELTVIAYAEDEEQAREYQTLLNADDIPVTLKENNSDHENSGIAIMVPEDHIDEASVIIESNNIYNELYEFGIDENNEFPDEDDDFPDDIF